MGFATRLTTRKLKTSADYYTAWFDGLPSTEREAVDTALRDKVTWSTAELKPILETDVDHPAPKFGRTAFREWRNENFS